MYYEDENFIHEFDAGRVQMERMEEFCIEYTCKVEWNDIRSMFKMEGNRLSSIWMNAGREGQDRVNCLLKRKFPKASLSSTDGDDFLD